VTEGVTRTHMFQELGLIHVAETAAERAFKVYGEKEWKEDFDKSPHGQPWHVSFHASQFPGDSQQACARKALYSMMDIPNAKPIDRAGRTVMAMGKVIEDQYVWAFHHAGMLLSATPDAEIQTGFRLPHAWLTASTDAVIRPDPSWNKGHAVEIKSKDHDVIVAMKRGEKGADPEHVKQCKVYISLAHLFSPFYWPDLDPVDTGSILYVSRSRPERTHEFIYQMDEEMFDAGIAKLMQWKQFFIDGELPERPKDWPWSTGVCQFCDVKNITIMVDGEPVKLGCKEDNKRGISRLSDSTLVDFAKWLNPKYDFKKTVSDVLEFWE
jgi:hypothetical protein